MSARSQTTGEPGYAAFGAVSNDWSVGTGVEGWVKYQSGPLLLQLSWDVPFVATHGNSGSAEITGQSPTRFRATAHIGDGHDAKNDYDVHLSDWWKYPGCAKDIAVDRNQVAWVIGCSPTSGGFVIRRWDYQSKSWKPQPGGANRIAVSPDGIPWITTTDGKIYSGQTDEKGNVKEWGKPKPGCGSDVAVGADGRVWLVGCSDATGGKVLRRWDDPSNSWKAVPGGGKRIAAGLGGRPWIVNNDGLIASLKDDGSGWDHHPGCGTDIAVGPNGEVWILGCDQVSGGWPPHKWIDKFPRVLAQPWQRAAGGGTAISVGPDGRPWIANDIGNIYQRYAANIQ
jgi:hypothetical protein